MQDLLSVPLAEETGSAGESRAAGRIRSGLESPDLVNTPLEIAPNSALMAAINTDQTALYGDLDGIESILDDEGALQRIIIGSAVGLTTGLTVGYVFWTIRAGYLLTSLIAQRTAWRFVDPLPILNSFDADTINWDGESLESILQSRILEGLRAQNLKHPGRE